MTVRAKVTNLKETQKKLDEMYALADVKFRRKGGDFNFKMATLYVERLKRNIVTQRFAGYYAPLSKKYAKWKLKKVGHLKFWILYSDLLNSISVTRTGKGWLGGITEGSVNQFGKDLTIIADINEAMRPVFRPTLIEFEAKDLPREIGRVLDDFGAYWGGKPR